MLPDVRFDPDRHTYMVRGVAVPSVTTVLNPLNELDGIPADVLAAAARFGTHVHLACHLWNVGELDLKALDPHLLPYLNGWVKFLKDSGAVVLVSERRVYHPKLQYAGTLDAVVRWENSTRLIDLKSSVKVPRTVGPQTAGYAEAYRSEGHELSSIRGCVHLLGDGGYRLHRLTDRGDFHIFLSALNIASWRNKTCKTLSN
jgi:hypothetical protein